MLLWIFLLIATVPESAGAASFTAEEVKQQFDCFRRPVEDPALEELGFVSRQFDRFFGGVIEGHKGINEWEKKVLKKHPDLGLVLGSVRCRSRVLSAAICGLDPRSKDFPAQSNDEESDAIRHFLFAFMLASASGPEKARLYVTAHEDDPDKWTARELMDLMNNETGLQLYESMVAAGGQPNFGDYTLYALALQQLKNRKLLKGREGESRCAHPDTIEVETDYRKFQAQLREVYRNFRVRKNACEIPF